MLSILKKISIEPVVLFYVLAIFAEYDVIGDLLFVSKCIDHLRLNQTNELHHCTEELKNNKTSEIFTMVSRETNNAQQIYNALLYSTSIISSFLAASYADRSGKLLPILIPLVGSAVVQIFILGSLAIFPQYSDNNNGLDSNDQLPFLFSSSQGLLIIFLCSIISGITGGTSTLLSSCFAYVSEICHPRQRTARITIVEACLFGGGFFAFTIAGAIMKKFPNSLERYRVNFGIFLTSHLLMIIYVLIRRRMFSKQSTTARTTRNDQSSSSSSSTTLKLLITSVFFTISRKRPHRNQRFCILLLLFAYILMYFWTVSITTILFIYTRNLLGWKSWQYSYFTSGKFAICGIFLCLLPIIQWFLNTRSSSSSMFSNLSKITNDDTIIFIGLLSRTISIILMGLASLFYQDFLMWIGLAAIIFAEYPIPALRSLMTRLVDPNEKAQIFAVMAALQSICFFTGGIGFLSLYNLLLDNIGPGWIFITMGLLQIISIFIFCYVKHLMKDSSEQLSITSAAEVIAASSPLASNGSNSKFQQQPEAND